MAMDLGIDKQSSSRISSAIKYSLILAGNNGNSAVLYDNLINYVSNLLGIEPEITEDEIINLKAKQEIF